MCIIVYQYLYLLSKHRFQEALKIDQCWGPVLIDFSFVLGPSWSHVGHLSRPKTLPRRLQDASKTVQDTSKDALDRPRRPKTPPHLPWSLPNLDFGRFLIDFWSIFDRISIAFWSIVHWFFIASPSLCCLITCVLGAVAGTQLCCALDTYLYSFGRHGLWNNVLDGGLTLSLSLFLSNLAKLSLASPSLAKLSLT